MNDQQFDLRDTLVAHLADPDTFVVIGMRHGQKEVGSGDVPLTDHGREQAGAAMRHLSDVGFVPDLIAYSGAFRTFQMAKVARSLWSAEERESIEDPLFHFAALAEQFFPNDPRACLNEAAHVKEAGGTVAVALTMSEYARAAREQVTDGILSLTDALREVRMQSAIFFSHSPLFECATVDTEGTPYGVGECDAVVWVVKWDRVCHELKLVASYYIPAPLPGAANV